MLAGLGAAFGMSHRMDQRQIVDHVRMSGRFLAGGLIAFFHIEYAESCLSFAEGGPNFFGTNKRLISNILQKIQPTRIGSPLLCGIAKFHFTRC